MTPVEIKLESGLIVAVIFIENMPTVMLTDVRKKIREEVDELVPEQFNFISNWGPPISRFQETKIFLTDALHNGNVLMLREMSSNQYPSKRKATEVETSENVDVIYPATPEAKLGEVTEGSAAPGTTDDTSLPSTSTSTEGERPPAKRPIQQTLTSLFGAKSSPTARYATAAVRKGVHIYSQQEILRSSGGEKERRKWWNEKAKQLCEDPQLGMLRGEAIDQKLHEWRLHKGTKMIEEEMETREAIKAIVDKYPDLEAFLGSKNKLKRETLTRNKTRLEVAVQTMTRSRDTVQKLSVRLQNTEKRGVEFQKLQKEMDEQRESHKFYYRELGKAQEAMNKVLSIKKSQLRVLMEKKEDYTTDAE